MGFWDFNDEQEDTVKTRTNMDNLFSYATNPIGAIARDLQDDKLNPLDAAATGYATSGMGKAIVDSNPEYGYDAANYRRIQDQEGLEKAVNKWKIKNTMNALFGQPFKSESIFDVSTNPVNRADPHTRGATMVMDLQPEGIIDENIGKLFRIPGKESSFNKVLLENTDDKIKDMMTAVHEWRHTEQPKDTTIYEQTGTSGGFSKEAADYYGQGREIDARLEQLSALNNAYNRESNNEEVQRLIRDTLYELIPFMDSYTKANPNDPRIQLYNKWVESE